MRSTLFVMLLAAWLSLAADPLVVFFVDPSFSEYSGDAMVVSTPGGRHFVVDGGMYSSYPPVWDCGEERVLPLLDSLGVTYLDGVVGTHPDADHIGGLISVYDAMPVVTAYDSGWPYGSTWIYETYLQAINRNGALFETPRRGDILDWGPELTVEVLHPDTIDLSTSTNNASLVLRVTYGDVAFLLTGDLETDGEEDILSEWGDVTADVLKVGHHGSATSTCTQWLAAVDPEMAAICVGAGNPYGHPHQEVMQRLYDRGITTYSTGSIGTFYIATDGTGIYVNSLPPEEGGGGVEGFAAFPSPATTHVSFSWDTGGNASISVYNLAGELVHEATGTGGLYSWDLATDDGGLAAPGLYAVLCESGGETCVTYFALSR